MKRTTSMGLIALLVINSLFFASCKRNFTCTCTTTVGGISNTRVYDLPNEYPHDANRACRNFETNANDNGVGTTNCHL
ncbi:MAG: hypothetical protein JST82_12615 [Bacteroidetes bacterium]|nr:hypothetical protein [Bacteroidota bacterium]